MAVLERPSTNKDNQQSQMVTELVAELRNPSEDPDAPLIIVEREAPNLPAKHLFVVWDEWEELTPLQRSRVVMRAYEQFLGNNSAEITQVTLAMGYLPDEARRMGIEIDN